MTYTELFTYTERVNQASETFMTLVPKYLNDPTFSLLDFIAIEYEIEPSDLIVAIWEINNQDIGVNND